VELPGKVKLSGITGRSHRLRYGLLADPGLRKFVDWVANKDPDFTATMTKKQR
jgi:hypothetical protein